jgi:hypothetical protein
VSSRQDANGPEKPKGKKANGETSMTSRHRIAASLVLGLGLISMLGCSSNPGMVADRVPIEGTVTLNGKPVGNVALQLQPLDVGQLVVMDVAADGRFRGEAVPGRYAYSFTVASGDRKGSAFKAIPSQYHDTNMERTIQVRGGSPIELGLR